MRASIRVVSRYKKMSSVHSGTAPWQSGRRHVKPYVNNSPSTTLLGRQDIQTQNRSGTLSLSCKKGERCFISRQGPLAGQGHIREQIAVDIEKRRWTILNILLPLRICLSFTPWSTLTKKNRRGFRLDTMGRRQSAKRRKYHRVYIRWTNLIGTSVCPKGFLHLWKIQPTSKTKPWLTMLVRSIAGSPYYCAQVQSATKLNVSRHPWTVPRLLSKQYTHFHQWSILAIDRSPQLDE